jgi:hypothetical protein
MGGARPSAPANPIDDLPVITPRPTTGISPRQHRPVTAHAVSVSSPRRTTGTSSTTMGYKIGRDTPLVTTTLTATIGHRECSGPAQQPNDGSHQTGTQG